jgi:signal transduction histidine kinase
LKKVLVEYTFQKKRKEEFLYDRDSLEWTAKDCALGRLQKTLKLVCALPEFKKAKCLIEAERLTTVGEMSNRIAHELRNSLTVVGGLARRLHGKSNDKDRDREYLKIIFEEVKTLEDKVSNLIKLGAGEENPRLEERETFR